jgi:Zn-dependent peptidase ImmA (M78 family)
MKFSLNKLSDCGFNRKFLTEKDFYDICEKENITVLEIDVSTSFFMTVEGKSFIVLKSRLKGLPRVFTMFHELAHYFLHGANRGTNAFYFGMLQSKAEFEADALATIALVPRFALNSYDFLEEHPNRYARKLFKNRQKLEFLYGV